MIIAIDGLAASGKGTLGRRLAQRLGYAYLDTGMLYRAVARQVLDTGTSPFNTDKVIEIARSINLADIDLPGLRDEEVSRIAPIIAGIREVRDHLCHAQREFAHHPPPGMGGVILDGRDIGTVVCPEAEVKLFVVANLEKRARRRHQELKERGDKVTFTMVHKMLRDRDKQDQQRDVSPLKPAPDALSIDTSDLDPEQVLSIALGFVEKKRT